MCKVFRVYEFRFTFYAEIRVRRDDMLLWERCCCCCCCRCAPATRQFCCSLCGVLCVVICCGVQKKIISSIADGAMNLLFERV